LATISLPVECTNFSKANKNQEKQHWCDPMNTEFNAFISNNTWNLFPRSHDKHVIRNKWVYKLKQKSNEIIDWYKARLVAKDLSNKMGLIIWRLLALL
jgi:hypothetical protein